MIAILASLLLPALGRAKDRAREAVCLGHVRQVSLAMIVEMTGVEGRWLEEPFLAHWLVRDFGVPGRAWICPGAPVRPGRLPWAANAPENAFMPGAVDRAWTHPRWVRSLRLRWQDKAWSEESLFPGDAPEDRAGSYAINAWFAWEAWNDVPNRIVPEAFQRESDVVEPSRTPMVGDGQYHIAWGRATDTPPRDLHGYGGFRGPGPNIHTYCLARHGSRSFPIPQIAPSGRPLMGAVNMAMADGHARRVALDDLWQLSWHRNYVAPVRRPGLP